MSAGPSRSSCLESKLVDKGGSCWRPVQRRIQTRPVLVTEIDQKSFDCVGLATGVMMAAFPCRGTTPAARERERLVNSLKPTVALWVQL